MGASSSYPMDDTEETMDKKLLDFEAKVERQLKEQFVKIEMDLQEEVREQTERIDVLEKDVLK